MNIQIKLISQAYLMVFHHKMNYFFNNLAFIQNYLMNKFKNYALVKMVNL